MPTQSISFFDDQGRVTGTLTSDPSSIQANKDHFPGKWVEGAWLDKPVYVRNGRVHPRPANPAKLTGFTLTDLPAPGTLHINDTPYPYDESTVELEFSLPGTYSIRVESWPHLDKEFEIENPPL